ncbi:MAG: type I methionyl aminopeptidase [Oscillospiraceae bacterium]|jgi:methionyl aminopeptidase|nr:type I methionyl aminopeptidase [Oscillospiraceae bacterium]
MIVLKTAKDMEKIRDACKLSALALATVGEAVKPGVTTAELDKIVHKVIVSHGGKPSFLGYNGFPGSACISINDEVIHGIPSPSRVVKEGDIVSIDVGAFLNGFHGDNAYTFAAGEISEEAALLLRVTEESLYKGIEKAVPKGRLGDLGNAVESHVKQYGFAAVRDYVGHGVGRQLHEAPEVQNYGVPGRGLRLQSGMTIAIEPMINAKGSAIEVQPDGWTVLTASRSLSAHFEHTVAITDNGPVILTRV